MILYIIRHGSTTLSNSKKSDEERKLSQDGKTILRKVLTLARDIFSTKLDQIATSPYTRAIQTAEIAREILRPARPDFIVDDSLSPENTPYETYRFLGNQKVERLLIVSHQPIVGDLISDLMGSGSNIRMSPGSMARLDVKGDYSSREGILMWFVSAGVLSPSLE